MTNIFSRYLKDGGITAATLHTVFDASKDAPLHVQTLASTVPQIHQVMDSLREFVPLTPSATVGPHCDGDFYRLPNHYRSVSFLLPQFDNGDPDTIHGAIVFKGTEPLLPDFDNYLDWMLQAPFRASALPLGLHFPLDLKIPPAAMWIQESIIEQALATGVQQRFLEEYGRFGRLPVPLYVFKYTNAQVDLYARAIRARISEVAFNKISSKLEDGLGIEVYFYPTVPVRVADLYSGNLKDAFGTSLSSEDVACTVDKWTKLFAELLQLRYMPCVPWHNGLGGCVDAGNACLDGGFNDLLTLTPFDAIPSNILMRRSLNASVRMFADTIASYCNVATGGRSQGSPDSEASALAQRFALERIRVRLQECMADGHHVDDEIMYFLEQISTTHILDVLREAQANRDRRSQYVCDTPPTSTNEAPTPGHPGSADAIVA